MVIPSDTESARCVEHRLLDELKGHGYCCAAVFAIKLALEESLHNAIEHGNGRDPKKKIEISYEIDPRQVSITVTDQGPGFNPDNVPDPTVDENLEKPGGRGIMLMKAYMDEVSFNDCGNRVCMVKCNN